MKIKIKDAKIIKQGNSHCIIIPAHFIKHGLINPDLPVHGEFYQTKEVTE